MTLREIGEDRLISRLTQALPQGKDVQVGIGDDCAVIGRPRARHWQLLKTDVVVEGIHFLPGENARRVGWKALARAISDISAMGGIPQHALITLAASPDTEVAWVEQLYAGLSKAAERFEVSIVGGETSRSPGPLFLSIALTGTVERRRCVLRSGGKPGDAIFVTGRLGGSLSSGTHLDFMPRVPEARWLVERFRLHAMMDLSDGIGSDLPRLANASGCDFELWEERVPRSRGATVQQALADGEDFELLFTLPSRDKEALQDEWKRRFPRLPLTQIGVLSESKIENRKSKIARGFDHFSK
jgi:thiamine-monophosphate kinase